jgi:redox-sensitive bicupin YhaK (pirin superfamily)
MTGEHPLEKVIQPTPTSVVSASRRVVYRTRGKAHGPLVRMVSASDVGQLIKPFVFLDLVDTQQPLGQPGLGWHPHSGIATLTLAIEGEGRYADSTGKEGATAAGDIEYLNAGRGVWHSGFALPPIRGFQLWIALPPERELDRAFSQHLSATEIPSDGPARVLLGRSGKAVSTIGAPPGLNFFDVQLEGGRRWRYQPPPGHSVAWIAVMDGRLRTPAPVDKGELAVFDPTDAAIEFEALTHARFVLGTAIPHPHALHLGNYSVHTSAAALSEGEQEIARIGRELRSKGVLRQT